MGYIEIPLGKHCSVCKQTKSISEFNKNGARHDGLQQLCRSCAKERYDNDAVYQRTLARNRGSQARRTIDYRQKAFALLGSRCVCCGESHLDFLCVDHVNGGGREHRKKTGNGWTFYRWLSLHHHEHPGEFQILCANCNMAKERGGCPPSHTGINR